ncbi:MAG: hypothetical protein ABIR79_17160 [Candidatus Binatia bacterium]
MMRTLKSGLTIGMLVAAMALTSGCGDNDNSGDNGNDNGNPNPQRTATPAPQRTATPANPNPTPTSTAGGNPVAQTVTFGFTSAAAIQAFQVRAAYQTADGNFTGSIDAVACTLTGSGLLTKNDNDTGLLTLSVANASALTFPISIACSFDATSGITASDITVTVQEVTVNNAPGNIADLTVATTIS